MRGLPFPAAGRKVGGVVMLGRMGLLCADDHFPLLGEEWGDWVVMLRENVCGVWIIVSRCSEKSGLCRSDF